MPDRGRAKNVLAAIAPTPPVLPAVDALHIDLPAALSVSCAPFLDERRGW
jgi:hypothetical protein